MKNLILLLVFILSAGYAHAAESSRQLHPVYVSARFVNMESFSDYVFVHLETLNGRIKIRKIIRPKGGVVKDSRANKLEILAVPKSLYDSAGSLEGLDLIADSAILRASGAALESGRKLISGPSSVCGKEVYYTISIRNGVFSLTKNGEKEFREVPNYPPVNLLLIGFIVSFVLELLIFFVFTRLVFRLGGPGIFRSAFSVLMAQAVTLPVLGYLINHYSIVTSGMLATLELATVAAEGAVYKLLSRLSWVQALIISLVANIAFLIFGCLA
jgi:hypothetical protein